MWRVWLIGFMDAVIAEFGPPGLPVSMVLVDLDQFKVVNDNYGHVEGDEALGTVSQTLRAYSAVVSGAARVEPVVVPAPVTAERLVEIGVALAVAVLTAPLVGGLALMIRVVDGSPVLHRATRVGRAGVPFTVYKLRTMRPGTGAPITAHDDARITSIGAVLRRWKLDELPQLWNVITGDMSLVGPRPEDPRYVAAYTPTQLRLLSVRPGVTSPATMASLDEEEVLAGALDPERAYVEEILPAKLALDLEWLANRSTRGDARILVTTLWRMLTPR